MIDLQTCDIFGPVDLGKLLKILFVSSGFRLFRYGVDFSANRHPAVKSQ
jgi:hypothetical protein